MVPEAGTGEPTDWQERPTHSEIVAKVPLSPSEITQKHRTQHKDRDNLLRERTLG